MEKLRAYVIRVMQEKGLSEWQIQKRANGKVSDSYVKSIISGKAKSISVEKLNALAVGLGVDGVELYRVASGEDIPQKEEDPWPGSVLLNALQKIMTNPELTTLTKTILRLKPAKIKAILKSLEAEK
jgi:transcriptional regulator with XRE-family HTH domain